MDLVANGVHGIHVYAMNKPVVARRLAESLARVLGR